MQEATAGMTQCVVCESEQVEEFLNLGRTALANRFLTAGELRQPEATFPLRVGFCHVCGHVQLTDRVPPGEMFTEYLYVSAASDTLRAHLYDLSDVVMSRSRPGADELVVDIGCNDATLLRGFKRYGVRTLGVDPAKNLAALDSDSGIDRFVTFFNAQTADQILRRWGPAAVITATNTFPHIPDVHDFIRGVTHVLAPGGVLVLEMHYLLDLVEQCAFDTVYHEHVSYWALGPLRTVLRRFGMEVTNAERLPLHHGQLRVFVQRKGEGQVQLTVDAIQAEETAKGIGRFETYQDLARRAMQIKEDLVRLISAVRSRGQRVAGYGAPAKGNTLLSFLGIGPDKIQYIVDRSPLKQGRYTPGMHIPVVSPTCILEDQPDYVLLLAWNFATEIMEQQAEYRRRGGKFIIPVPKPQIV